MIVGALTLLFILERCATSLFSAVHITKARPAPIEGTHGHQARRTSGCTMIGSAALSGYFVPEIARPCRRSFA